MAALNPAERRRIVRAAGELVDYAIAQLAPDDAPARKLEGPGWSAYVYRTHGPGSECVRLELRVGEGWKERVGQ